MVIRKRLPVQLTWSIIEERGQTFVTEDDGAAVLKHGPFSRGAEAQAFINLKRTEVEQVFAEFNKRQRPRPQAFQ